MKLTLSFVVFFASALSCHAAERAQRVPFGADDVLFWGTGVGMMVGVLIFAVGLLLVIGRYVSPGGSGEQ